MTHTCFLSRCKIPGLDNDTYEIQDEFHQSLVATAIPPGSDGHVYDQCRVYTDIHRGNSSIEKCNEWVYDTSVYKNTFAKQVSGTRLSLKGTVRISMFSNVQWLYWNK